VTPTGKILTDCNDLSSTQEEADTRIVLYALNADKLYRENKVKGPIVVKSPDTDVERLGPTFSFRTFD
jgi:hypothetical protein